MNAIDLFAGAGGFTLGAEMAGANVVWAANHWPDAVRVHSSNHAGAEHSCRDLQQADWTQVPPHDLLMASPACQGHSRARGRERPHHDDLRSTAWAVVSAAEAHRPEYLVVENVPEFGQWVLYQAWCQALHALGYALNMQIIDAADHGVPQHRRRLFVVGTRTRHPAEMSLAKADHVPVSSVVDFDAGRWSVIEKPGRSERTIERVQNGRRKFGDRFLTAYYGNERGGRSLNRPIGTLTTTDRYGVIDGERMRMLSTSEATACMGFPAGYQLPDRHRDAMKMLGNAVVPQVACDVISALVTE